MARKLLDRQAGALPVIRADRDSLIFHMQIPGVPKTRSLVIRCDDAGSVWASIENIGEPSTLDPDRNTRTCW